MPGNDMQYNLEKLKTLWGAAKMKCMCQGGNTPDDAMKQFMAQMEIYEMMPIIIEELENARGKSEQHSRIMGLYVKQDKEIKELTEEADAYAVTHANTCQALEAIKEWAEPQPGAGAEIGPLYGSGMYAQYDADRKKHREQIVSILQVAALD